MNKISTDKNFIILVLLGTLFFFVYSFFSFNLPNKFNSPDEAANYFFITQFIENSILSYNEPLNDIENNNIHPRNTISIDSNIVPYSFIGLYLIAGFLGKLFTFSIIYFVVPFFSCLSVIFFYLALREIFISKVAFLSSILLFIHPAFWYFSSKPFFHNALFVSLFIISFYFFIKIIKGSGKLNYIFFGIFLGLAIITRTSEIIWLIILYILSLIYFRNKIIIKYLPLLLLFFLLTITPLLIYNNVLYDDPFTAGYTSNISNSTNNTKQSLIFEKVSKIIFPKGLNSDIFLETTTKYFYKIFPIYSLFTVLGVIYVLVNIKKYNKTKKIYLIFTLTLSFYLILYYGNDAFHGVSGISNDYTISSSLVRYWLPVYIFLIPFAATLILKLVNLKYNRLRIILLFIILILFLYPSIKLVYFENNSGLIKNNENIKLFSEIESNINEIVPNDGIIVTSFADKFIFPRRKVIGLNKRYNQDKFSESKIKSISRFQEIFPIYYIAIFGIDINNVNYKLRPYNLKIVPVDVILDTASIYKFEEISS